MKMRFRTISSRNSTKNHEIGLVRDDNNVDRTIFRGLLTGLTLMLAISRAFCKFNVDIESFRGSGLVQHRINVDKVGFRGSLCRTRC